MKKLVEEVEGEELVKLIGEILMRKKLVEEVEDEGLVKLIGENVLLMCANYFYHGKLVGVNEDSVMLENPGIVYETGEWSATQFKDKQNLPTKNWYVVKSAIESYGRIF